MRAEWGALSYYRSAQAHAVESQAPRHGRNMCLAHGWGARSPVSCEKSHIFLTFFPLKARDFSPSQEETFPINTIFVIHNFSFRIGVVQEEGDSRSFRRSSIFSLTFLSFCNLSLVTMCN